MSQKSNSASLGLSACHPSLLYLSLSVSQRHLNVETAGQSLVWLHVPLPMSVACLLSVSSDLSISSKEVVERLQYVSLFLWLRLV